MKWFDEEESKKMPHSEGIVALALVWAYSAWSMWSSGWVFPLDSATLTLHEAGHPIVGVLGDRWMVYGGSLFQLAFPLAVLIHFKRAGEPLGSCFGLIWLGTAIHAMGIYMADARDQALPLVGNGDRIHDWFDIFGRFGLLKADKMIGGFTMFVGWLAMAACAALLAWLWVKRERG